MPACCSPEQPVPCNPRHYRSHPKHPAKHKRIEAPANRLHQPLRLLLCYATWYSGLFAALMGVIPGPQAVAAQPATTPRQATGPVARRIVSLAPSLTEMLFAIGAGNQLVGRTSACDWPAEAKRIPVAGAFGRPSLEMLLSLQPDLVVETDLAETGTGQQITELGIRRATLPCTSPDDIPVVMRQLGTLTGHTRQADSLAQVITNGLASFRKQEQGRKQRRSLYLEIWNNPLWTGGKGSYTSALVSCAGGYNIGEVVNKDYFEISQEWVIRQNPDVIACMYMSRKVRAAESLMNRPGWQYVAAVKNGRVYDRFQNSLFLRPGPRVLEGIRQLHAILYPEEASNR